MLLDSSLLFLGRPCGRETLTHAQAIHDITAPVLYSEVVVDNPAGLLYGIDRGRPAPGPAAPPITSSVDPNTASPVVRMHKRDLLAKVTSVHYVYSPLDENPFAGYEAQRYPITRDPQLVIDEVFRSCDFERYTGAARALGDQSVESLFPRLEKRTLNTWGHHTFGASPGLSAVTGEMSALTDQLSSCLPIPYARLICGHSQGGPFGYRIHHPLSLPNLARPAGRVQVNVVHQNPVMPWFDRDPTGRHVFLQGYVVAGSHNYLDLAPGIWFKPFYRIFSGRQVSLLLTNVHRVADVWKACIDQSIIDDTRITFLFPRPSDMDEAADLASDGPIMENLRLHLETAREEEHGERKELGGGGGESTLSGSIQCPRVLSVA